MKKEMTEKDRCLHHFFEEQVDQNPSQIALIYKNRQYSYLQVEQISNRLSHLLHAKGIESGSLIALYFNRSELPIISILAVLKAGAGYVPVDPSLPPQRIEHIMDEAGVNLILTEKQFKTRCENFKKRKIIALDEEMEKLTHLPENRPDLKQMDFNANNICYVIYTSGTTGNPKGITTEHKNVVHFVDSFNKVCGLEQKDRVYQGFSYGFDGSVEEMWMAFSNGATLVVGPQEIGQLGNDTADYINEKKVTFFSTVPTFLKMISRPMDTVRLLVLSGEQCPAELVEKWADQDRKLLNVYGPTETTVNTTAALCKPDQPITIGKPLDGYEILILDEQKKPVPPGEAGELYIGGHGLARGYLNKQELTDKSFINYPHNGIKKRLYKTGDKVKLNTANELVFLGRIDNQVKIRGYRIELPEIEAVLESYGPVTHSVVTVHENNGLKSLAAYIQVESKIESEDLRNYLHKKLPPYMVPAYLDVLEEMPRLTSGKIDRKKLPPPLNLLIKTSGRIIAPQTELESQLLKLYQEILKVDTISTDNNFFTDLGGYSLLAAQLAVKIRATLRIEIAIREIYANPDIKQLAQLIEEINRNQVKEQEKTVTIKNKEYTGQTYYSVPFLLRNGCKLLQAISQYFFYGLRLAPLGIAFFSFILLINHKLSLLSFCLISVTLFFALPPVLLSLTILGKWLLIGRYKAGRYKVWGGYYFRWWLVSRLQALSGAASFAGTPIMSLYYRLMGAKVGKNCIIDTALASAFDLIEIGENSCICNETQLTGCRVENGYLILDQIKIGANCFVGIHSNLGLNVSMENNTALGDLSLLADHKTIPRGEKWSGSPAKKSSLKLPHSQNRKRHGFIFGIIHLILGYFNSFFILLTTLPGLVLSYYCWFYTSRTLFFLALFAAVPISIVSFCMGLALLKAVLLGQVKPGVYPVESWFYLRKWIIDSLVRFSCLYVKPLYTTIYLPAWLRLLGAKIGKYAEISTVSQISPELMEIGDSSFFADGSIIGGRHFYQGHVELAKSCIGSRSFIGNSAILPIGAKLGDDCLIGCLSTPPAANAFIPDKTEWLGSPSFQLPFRKKVEGFADSVTYKPTLKLYILRLFIDTFRILLPGSLYVSGGLLLYFSLYYTYQALGLMLMLLAAPIYNFLMASILSIMVALIKTVLMGKFKPVIKPLWCVYVWLNEAVNGAYESVVGPALSPLLGTPFYAFFLRLMGCKIGKNVYLGTTLFSEFDLVKIGNHVSLNAGAVIQNHLFEDRIMKSDYLSIKENCNVGNMAIILYNTIMQEGSSIGPLSLLMKGDQLPAGSRWQGIPIEKN